MKKVDELWVKRVTTTQMKNKFYNDITQFQDYNCWLEKTKNELLEIIREQPWGEETLR